MAWRDWNQCRTVASPSTDVGISLCDITWMERSFGRSRGQAMPDLSWEIGGHSTVSMRLPLISTRHSRSLSRIGRVSSDCAIGTSN